MAIWIYAFFFRLFSVVFSVFVFVRKKNDNGSHPFIHSNIRYHQMAKRHQIFFLHWTIIMIVKNSLSFFRLKSSSSLFQWNFYYHPYIHHQQCWKQIFQNQIQLIDFLFLGKNFNKQIGSTNLLLFQRKMFVSFCLSFSYSHLYYSQGKKHKTCKNLQKVFVLATKKKSN